MQEVKRGYVLLRVLYSCGIVPRANYEQFWHEFVTKCLRSLDINSDDLPSDSYDDLKHAFSFFKKDISKVKSALAKDNPTFDISSILGKIKIEKVSGSIRELTYDGKVITMQQIKEMCVGGAKKNHTLFKTTILNSEFTKLAYGKFMKHNPVLDFKKVLKESSLAELTQNRYCRDFELFHKFMLKQKTSDTIQSTFEIYK